MDPRKCSLRWVAAFAAAAAVGVTGVVVVLSVMGGGEGQATAEGTTPTVPPMATEAVTTPAPLATAPLTTPGTTQATRTPGPGRPVVPHYQVAIPTLPSGFTLPPKRPCPYGWQRISDDVLNYSICIPPDWGILNEKTGERSSASTLHGQSAKILSPEGFPYPVGVPLDKPLQDPDTNLIYMALGSAPPGSSIVCRAEPRSSLGPLPAAECQLRFDYTDLGDQDFSPDGNMVETEIVVPLLNPLAGPGGSRAGYGLLIGIVGTVKAMGVHGDIISQIVGSVEGQP